MQKFSQSVNSKISVSCFGAHSLRLGAMHPGICRREANKLARALNDNRHHVEILKPIVYRRTVESRADHDFENRRRKLLDGLKLGSVGERTHSGRNSSSSG